MVTASSQTVISQQLWRYWILISVTRLNGHDLWLHVNLMMLSRNSEINHLVWCRHLSLQPNSEIPSVIASFNSWLLKIIAFSMTISLQIIHFHPLWIHAITLLLLQYAMNIYSNKVITKQKHFYHHLFWTNRNATISKILQSYSS